jgi:hypothetical protein
MKAEAVTGAPRGNGGLAISKVSTGKKHRSMDDLPRPRRLSLLDGMIILVFILMASAAVLRTGLRPRDALAGVAVVFPPWTSAEDAVLRATAPGGSVVRLGAIPAIVVVSAKDPGYADRVLAAGALLVLDPQALAICAPVLLPPNPAPS